MDNLELTLRKIYYNPEHPASFGSIVKLHAAARIKIKGLKRKQVEDWLSAQDTYTLHRAIKRKFLRVPTYANHVDSVWQLDTADVRHLAEYNDGIKYLLIIIDVLSRFAFVVAMHTKESSRVVKSFQQIRDLFNRTPQIVVSDPGLEFRGEFTDYLKQENIQQYLLRKEQKAPLAERFIRTLKEKMVKYMTHEDTQTYVPVIGELVRSYNNAVHSRTKHKPIDVNKDMEDEMKKILYGKYEGFVFYKDGKFQPGDMVRQVRKLKALDKGTTQTTTNEVFIVKFIDFSRPPRILYYLTDINHKDIKGRFYEDELVRVKTLTDPRQYMKSGEKRIKKTKRKTQVFKTFKGWPNKFDIRIK